MENLVHLAPSHVRTFVVSECFICSTGVVYCRLLMLFFPRDVFILYLQRDTSIYITRAETMLRLLLKDSASFPMLLTRI